MHHKSETFIRKLVSASPELICALAVDAAERGESHAQANFYPEGEFEYLFFQVSYLDRIDELKAEAQAAYVIERAKGGGVAK